MGGCCCCSSRGVEISSGPAYYYYPTASDERVPLSSHGVAASALSTGLLVDTNLEVSVPDAYRPPPAPVPFDAILGPPQTPSVAQIRSSKSDEAVQSTNVDSGQETVAANTRETCTKSEDTKGLGCKEQSDTEIESPKELEVELSKPVEPVVSTKEEEDVCPTCLEEYDAENPKIITKCEHHFHLACILEWMERSDTCPVCDKVCLETIFIYKSIGNDVRLTHLLISLWWTQLLVASN
ncbi:E3 ubiquitin-protein ligase isoform X1 [Gossypium australe]|uniref:RING-type E3 ubiquitin transferase n=1 Tax=Gossypium australe TaxID=47621 RepID=A0A5B6TUP5_9ROSI|nr:E3 ubiquitin-protein ligase isoform X1 [Gossypium australe]